ncbi:voltage-gated chloride channel family protein, partial [bacterium]|nr:voltage-gated chloride channel family protein [bacterium]
APLVPSFSVRLFLVVIVAGVVFGGAARLFCRITYHVESLFSRIKYPPLRPCLAGGMLVLAYQAVGTTRYAGLGIDTIQQALQIPVSILDPILKAAFTALTLGGGFKGGEFVPLVFIGTTLGSAMSVLVPGSGALLATVGFAAVFGAAANAPFACAVMAIELFGIRVAPFAIAGCMVAHFVSGKIGIYKGQR